MIGKVRGLLTAVLVTASLTVPTASADELTPRLNWTACPQPDAPAQLRRASLQVPVDYARPHGLTATITVNRLPATGAHPAHRPDTSARHGPQRLNTV